MLKKSTSRASSGASIAAEGTSIITPVTIRGGHGAPVAGDRVPGPRRGARGAAARRRSWRPSVPSRGALPRPGRPRARWHAAGSAAAPVTRGPAGSPARPRNGFGSCGRPRYGIDLSPPISARRTTTAAPARMPPSPAGIERPVLPRSAGAWRRKNRYSVRNSPTPSAPASSARAASSGLRILASSAIRWPSRVAAGRPRTRRRRGRGHHGGRRPIGELVQLGGRRVDDDLPALAVDGHGRGVAAARSSRPADGHHRRNPQAPGQDGDVRRGRAARQGHAEQHARPPSPPAATAGGRRPLRRPGLPGSSSCGPVEGPDHADGDVPTSAARAARSESSSAASTRADVSAAARTACDRPEAAAGPAVRPLDDGRVHGHQGLGLEYLGVAGPIHLAQACRQRSAS